VNNCRLKFSTAAAFVDGTDTRYGLSSKDILDLGGSELSRLEELISTDHEWADKASKCGGIQTRPPPSSCRIVVKLFWDVAPLACENFATLCLNGGKLPVEDDGKSKQPKPPPIGESGKPLSYRGSTVHRIVPGFIIQAGDFVFGNGSGGESIYNGKKFKDERAGLALKHDRQGLLSMGNSGKNSNTSQFFFTFDKAPQCDGKHVVFGEIVSGFDTLRALEEVGSKSGDPTVPVAISDCGVYGPLITPGAGYWYDKPDSESFGGSTPVFIVRPRVCIVAPSEAVVNKFKGGLGDQCCVTAVICIDAESEGTAKSRNILQLIEKFSVDVVLVAPACTSIVEDIADIPASWKETTTIGIDIEVSEVIIKAKPVEALALIGSKSWMAKRRVEWKLDGV